MLIKKKLLLISILTFILQSFIIIALISIILRNGTNLKLELGDHWIYRKAIHRFWNGKNPFQEYFFYLPSFFLLSFLVYDFHIYAIFLIVCAIISLILLLRLEANKIIAFVMFFLSILTILSGNIDVFIFLVVLICLQEQKLSPFLLGFVSFKPTVILVLPYFLYKSENRFKFLIFYCLTVLLTNYYFLLNPDTIWIYYDYVLVETDLGFVFLRPYWIYYVYYYWLMENKQLFKEELLEAKHQQQRDLLQDQINQLRKIIVKEKKE